MQNEIQTQDIVTVMVKGLDTVKGLYQDTFRYEHAEIGGATKFTLYWDNVEIGQRIVYPGAFGGSPSVSDVFTAKDRTGGGIFENICKRLDDALNERLAEARKAETSASDGKQVALKVPTLPPGKYSVRRQKVLEMTLANTYSEAEIASDIEESRDIVHNDKAWLRDKGYLPKRTQT